MLSFPELICTIIVNLYEINPCSHYWWYINRKFYEDVIENNWEFPYMYDCEVGFESDTVGIFDSKYVQNEECIEQEIKNECELLFMEFGYNEIYEELWGMMYNETLNYVSKHIMPKQFWCALPYGVAVYKGPYESESLLVKRDAETNEINAVVIAHLWGNWGD